MVVKLLDPFADPKKHSELVCAQTGANVRTIREPARAYFKDRQAWTTFYNPAVDRNSLKAATHDIDSDKP